MKMGELEASLQAAVKTDFYSESVGAIARV